MPVVVQQPIRKAGGLSETATLLHALFLAMEGGAGAQSALSSQIKPRSAL